MKIKADRCYVRTDKSLVDDGVTITFVRSGFSGQWLKVYEDSSYSVDVSYAAISDIRSLNRRMKRRGVR